MTIEVKNLIAYILLLLGIFAIFFVLDSAGLQYSLDKPGLNKSSYHTENHDGPHERPSSNDLSHDEGYSANIDEQSFFTPTLKKWYVLVLSISSIFLAIRTFRNKPST